MSLPPYAYAFDPTGTLLANKIQNEQHVLTPVGSRDFYAFVPRKAPIFEDGCVLTHTPLVGATRPLVPGIDFIFTHKFLDASLMTQHPIFGSITILDKSLAGVLTFVQYQTVGERWTLDVNEWTQIVTQINQNPRVVSWEQLAAVPEQFPVIDHDFREDTTVGMESVRDELASVAEAILENPTTIPAHTHPAPTLAEIGLANVHNYAIATLVELIAGTPNRYLTSEIVYQRLLTLSGEISATLTAYIDTNFGSLAGLAAAFNALLADVTPRVDALESTSAIQAGQISTMQTALAGLAVLNNVSNFATANEAQTVTGTADNLFTTPKGVKAAIVEAINAIAALPAATETVLGKVALNMGTGPTDYLDSSRAVTATGLLNLLNIEGVPVNLLKTTVDGQALSPVVFDENPCPMLEGYGAGNVTMDKMGGFMIAGLGFANEDPVGGTWSHQYYAGRLCLNGYGDFGFGGLGRHAWSFKSSHNGDFNVVGVYTSTSDPRLKENFVQISDSMKIIHGLKGYRFNWRQGIEHIKGRWGQADVGFSSTEVMEVLPEAVVTSKTSPEGYQSVCYDKLAPVLVEAVKEKDAEIKQLQAEVASLKTTLSERLSQLEMMIARHLNLNAQG